MEARGTKTLVGGKPVKEPGWPVWLLMKGFRLVLLTVLWSGLGMGVGLFCGIVGVVAWGAIQHQTPEMDLAYRHVSIPIALCSGSCAFLWNLMRTVQAGVKRRKGRVQL
jgi:hypothetical protein